MEVDEVSKANVLVKANVLAKTNLSQSITNDDTTVQEVADNFGEKSLGQLRFKASVSRLCLRITEGPQLQIQNRQPKNNQK
jgi:hypothetical protein